MYTVKRRETLSSESSEKTVPVEKMLERNHGRFDAVAADYRYDGVNGDPGLLCAQLLERNG